MNQKPVEDGSLAQALAGSEEGLCFVRNRLISGITRRQGEATAFAERILRAELVLATTTELVS